MSLTLSGGDREHLPKWILFTRVIKEALPAENAGIKRIRRKGTDTQRSRGEEKKQFFGMVRSLACLYSVGGGAWGIHKI